MKTYIFVQGEAVQRGRNTSITVYRVVNNVPVYIDDNEYNTGSWKGPLATAHNLIAAKEGYKTDGYYITRKDVQVIQI